MRNLAGGAAMGYAPAQKRQAALGRPMEGSMRRLFLLAVVCMELAASRTGLVSAQQVPEGYTALKSYGFAVKKPVMAGACDSCP